MKSTSSPSRTFTSGPSFRASPEDRKLIDQIANRAVAYAKTLDIPYDKLTASMDITACHANGMPLDLSKLLAAADGDFGHDIFGIRRHINRDTGQIMDCFVPRCALPESMLCQKEW